MDSHVNVLVNMFPEKQAQSKAYLQYKVIETASGFKLIMMVVRVAAFPLAAKTPCTHDNQIRFLPPPVFGPEPKDDYFFAVRSDGIHFLSKSGIVNKESVPKILLRRYLTVL